VNCTPEGPLSPQNSSGPSTPRKHQANRLGVPPSVARSPLTIEFRHATKNCPAHSCIRTISGMCCVKNTQPAGASPGECASPMIQILFADQLVISSSHCNRERRRFFGSPGSFSGKRQQTVLAEIPHRGLLLARFVHSSATIGVTLLATSLRHCEERWRRSNQAVVQLLDCFALLCFALPCFASRPMTT
jgi:hypothetical protein